MGFFSGKQIERMIDNKTISITPDPQIGTASIDITLDTLFATNRVSSISCNPLEEKTETVKEFLSRRCTKLQFRDGSQFVQPRWMHIGYSLERVRLPNSIQRQVTGRSSAARLFLHIEADYDFDRDEMHGGRPDGTYRGRIPLWIRADDPGVRIYRREKYAQLFLRDGRHLMYDELVKVLKRGEVKIMHAGKPRDYRQHLDYENSRVILCLNPKLDIVTGHEIFDAHQESDHNFGCKNIARCSEGYLVPENTRFLASTLEQVVLSENYIGELEMLYRPVPLFGMSTHPNCPYHMPGAKNTLVLECHTDSAVLLRAGMPVVGMKIWPMNDRAEKYKGRYCRQHSVLRSMAHKGL